MPRSVDIAVPEAPKEFLTTEHGRMVLGNSLDVLGKLAPNSVDLIMTSPPFGLLREKEYGNVPAEEYETWFRPFAEEFRRVLKDSGSLVIDFGGAWHKGQPTRHLYHFEMLILLCKKYEFHLAQEFYWWNPSKLPSPAEWVTIRRVRVKDAINTVWWLSKTPWPKASNRRVLQAYSPSMLDLFKNGYQAKRRPSGHNISSKFGSDNGGAIPPNLLAIPNTESNSAYMRYCKENNLRPHPARFPAELPEFFIRMLTDEGDLVIDPFGGSCVTGEVAERMRRKWLCVELRQDYLTAAMGRFIRKNGHYVVTPEAPRAGEEAYKINRPGAHWTKEEGEALAQDGGKGKKLATPVVIPIVEDEGRRSRGRKSRL